jgi:hypothetical protein
MKRSNIVIDLNNVETTNVSEFDLIPADTIARAIITIKPNMHTIPEFSSEPLFRQSQHTSAKWIEVEYTIMGGQFDKRKFWQNHFFDGDAKDETGVSKSRKIGLSWLKSVLESHYDLQPTDASPEAQKCRQLDPNQGGIKYVDGMSVCVKLGIEKGTNGYDDKNKLKSILTNGMNGYIPRNEPNVQTNTSPQQPAQQGGVVPDWANK